MMRKTCVVFCLFFLVLSVSSEKRSRIRFYPDMPDDTNTSCLGIVCPRNFIFVPCTLGDGRKDTCVECPLDRPISVEKFDSAFFSEPPDNICKDPDEICVCTEEAKLMNPKECLNNLNPECQCDVSRGYIGSDPKLCKLSENPCSSTGFELVLNGSCLKCSDDKYKDQIGYGKCEQQPKCEHPYVVNQQGDFRTKRTCKLQPTVNTPFPGKTTSIPSSVPTTDKGDTSIPTPAVTVNDTSTNSPPGKEASSDEELILGVAVSGFIVATVITGVIYKVFRNRREDDCEEATIVLCNRCGRKNLNHIELNDVEQFNDGGKDTDNNNKETDGLLQDSILNLSETGEKDDLSIVDAKPCNTRRNGDQGVLQTGRTSESGSSLIGARSNSIPDMLSCGARPIFDESCQPSGSGVKSGKTKNDCRETLPKAIHRQPEIHSDSSKNVESVVKNANTKPGAIKIESVVSESTSVQSVDYVLNNVEECISKSQLPHSPDNVTCCERSRLADRHSVRSELNDTELKKEVSSEDTIVKASEQISTFSQTPSLHVDSMLSGGNTNSSGPSYMYLLRWEISGDDRPRRGRIEYWENQHYGRKSKVLRDLETGKVLLKSPQKYMTHNVVYLVPDNQNHGIEPFMQIKLEQLEDEIDIQSLLKSGATIYDLDTFEGIDNNTGNNEVQNEDPFNSLCLGSFENDN
ncbi:uncharacterized protein LOC127719913 isoform X2 [Mytilus californianus]|uniref:uncharacterized protein LOC127719913 isoform X2 n=1 Tax=Mytilus californianus TaxID=6549 RepID=UPI0022462EBA|nr:uncharacterized protein LOC127719913 isoform X2 [Mytilus californianus]